MGRGSGRGGGKSLFQLAELKNSRFPPSFTSSPPPTLRHIRVTLLVSARHNSCINNCFYFPLLMTFLRPFPPPPTPTNHYYRPATVSCILQLFARGCACCQGDSPFSASGNYRLVLWQLSSYNGRL